MGRNCFALVGVSALSLALTACGGGGGQVSTIPPPPPTPTPPPPPPPPPTVPAGYEKVAIFPGLTTSTSFASVGAELPGSASAPVTTDGFSVRYDASTNLYVFKLPSGDDGDFYANVSDANGWSGGLVRASSNPPGTVYPSMTVLKSVAADRQIDLSYTRLAVYSQAGAWYDLPHGYLAFGLATPAGGVPVTGSATYTAAVAGASVDYAYIVGGDATLAFDFGQGTLAGHLDPQLYAYEGDGTAMALGRYDFVSTVFGAGSTSFSGKLSNSDVAGLGTFQGQFTGPHAEELMSNWVAPFRDPTSGQTSTIGGVWVGKQR